MDLHPDPFQDLVWTTFDQKKPIELNFAIATVPYTEPGYRQILYLNLISC